MKPEIGASPLESLSLSLSVSLHAAFKNNSFLHSDPVDVAAASIT